MLVATGAGNCATGSGDAPPPGEGGNAGGLGGDGGNGGAEIPCVTECGDTERCEAAYAGRDDDCDGYVDEGCPCAAGQVEECFKGDAAYLEDPGCFPGSQKCTELGQWGECIGGVHATEMCFSGTVVACHPISTPPFVPVDLADGIGSFGVDAVDESYVVDCPPGVSPCPVVNGSEYQPLQSGEYTVTYTKTLDDDDTDACVFPLFVGAPGLRVELTWDWDTGLGPTVDLDLHVHKPGDAEPWGGASGSPDDCTWSNCAAFDYNPAAPNPIAPEWFTGEIPPDPVSWWLSPVYEENTCYFGPEGNGEAWQAIGLGCHNPRLDIDNLSCDPTVTDTQDNAFCNPENVNIDYPPTDGWIRIAVNYWSNNDQSYDVHPLIKVFCDGALTAELGPLGYDAPVTFVPSDGDGDGSDTSLFWLAADVLFLPDDECGTAPACIVEPIYEDAAAKTRFTTTALAASVSFPGPDYPPLP
jgi:hypothetical protein